MFCGCTRRSAAFNHRSQFTRCRRSHPVPSFSGHGDLQIKFCIFGFFAYGMFRELPPAACPLHEAPALCRDHTAPRDQGASAPWFPSTPRAKKKKKAIFRIMLKNGAATQCRSSEHLAEAQSMVVTGNAWEENPSLFEGGNVRSRWKIRWN